MVARVTSVTPAALKPNTYTRRTVAALPVPFPIAAARTSWRDYPALFLEAWSIVLRGAAAALSRTTSASVSARR